jgi:hypothetical protein
MMPTLYWIRGSVSDDKGPDADGLVLHFEWLGFVAELGLYRRGR